jgi:hypothetical protein
MPSWINSRTRILCSFPVLILASCFATASAGSSITPGCQGRPNLPNLSNFDYLVLASIADSPLLPAMASYRPAGTQHSAAGLLDRSADKHCGAR